MPSGKPTSGRRAQQEQAWDGLLVSGRPPTRLPNPRLTLERIQRLSKVDLEAFVAIGTADEVLDLQRRGATWDDLRFIETMVPDLEAGRLKGEQALADLNAYLDDNKESGREAFNWRLGSVGIGFGGSIAVFFTGSAHVLPAALIGAAVPPIGGAFCCVAILGAVLAVNQRRKNAKMSGRRIALRNYLRSRAEKIR